MSNTRKASYLILTLEKDNKPFSVLMFCLSPLQLCPQAQFSLPPPKADISPKLPSAFRALTHLPLATRAISLPCLPREPWPEGLEASLGRGSVPSWKWPWSGSCLQQVVWLSPAFWQGHAGTYLLRSLGYVGWECAPCSMHASCMG